VDLVQIVVSETGLSEDRAEDGLGAVFMAIRMAVDAKTFGEVATAFPDVGTWMQKAPLSARWTGEMLAMATPRALRRIMLNAGFKEEHVDGLWGAVGRGLRESIGAEPHKKIVEKLPVLSGE
jgi:hypothetical protein